MFQQLASVRNPNRAPLAHYDSSSWSRSTAVARSTWPPTSPSPSSSSSSTAQTITVTASGLSPVVATALALHHQQQEAPPLLEVDSLLVVKGKVTILRVFTHHVEASKVCRIGVSPADVRVLGFRY
ncbi:hypothetical protein GUJ93_ZPchr0006g42669 [Zizania palustris]|uniref:Late embryogenesis abundant protein LEA-2 subgroup domain-containing protein n=1 Tax=Zizania palustris TaxID=103762 RepID=A0A8J5VXJ6_ZIZPA|nr:hypothetical protein GUJ93_ZPchr0006g42669 [Zizania palustris]